MIATNTLLQAEQEDALAGPVLRRTGAYLAARSGSLAPSQDQAEAWQRFYRRCDPLVRKFVQRNARDPQLIEDCVQEVWLVLIRRLQSFHHDPARGRFQSWLYTVVRGVTIDHIRRSRRRHEQPFSPEQLATLKIEGPREPSTSSDRSRAVLDLARKQMSPDNFELMRLRCVQNQPVDEVAAAMGLTQRQVWFRLHRARKKLRRLCAPPA